MLSFINWSLFLTQLINGLQLGSIYALIALGYSMVYGIIKLTNFAHGDIIMCGGYVALFCLNAGMGPISTIAITILTSVSLSLLIEKIAYRPLRSAPKISLLITSIGVSIFIENLAQLLFTANPRPFPASQLLVERKVPLGSSLTISSTTLVTILVSIASMIVLTILVRKTMLGKAMRAVSEDSQTSRLMGININSVISFSFTLGAVLAAIAAILFCCRYPLINPMMGYMIGMKAFISAVLGGIGSIAGAVVGGFSIGLLEVFVNANGMSTWVDAVVFGVLIIVLLTKPSGILGKSQIEKI